MGVLCGLTGLVHLAMLRERPHDRFETEGTAL
jgi:hypothetical protein